jgi:hypothetical protein
MAPDRRLYLRPDPLDRFARRLDLLQCSGARPRPTVLDTTGNVKKQNTTARELSKLSICGFIQALSDHSNLEIVRFLTTEIQLDNLGATALDDVELWIQSNLNGSEVQLHPSDRQHVTHAVTKVLLVL